MALLLQKGGFSSMNPLDIAGGLEQSVIKLLLILFWPKKQSKQRLFGLLVITRARKIQ